MFIHRFQGDLKLFCQSTKKVGNFLKDSKKELQMTKRREDKRKQLLHFRNTIPCVYILQDILYNLWENEFLGDQKNNLWQWILINFMKEYF